MASSDGHHPPNPSAQQLQQSSELFARLFSQHQQGLYRYILMLVGSPLDASDVLQETAVVLLRKIDLFNEDQPFMPWAKKFAYYEVLKHRTAKAKRPPLLEESVLEQIRRQIDTCEPLFDARREALAQCLRKLPERQLEIIKMRYTEDIKPSEIAELTARPVQTIYTQLKRIRQSLLECINRSFRREARL